MYVPPMFRVPDDDVWPFVEARRFGTLIAVDGTRAVTANVPFFIDRTGPRPRLECHVARANPIHAVIPNAPEVTLLIDGPDAYISPDWYITPGQVPTWNYQRAELRGICRMMDDVNYAAHVERLSYIFEQRLLPKKIWSMDKVPPERLAMMYKAIVCFEIDVTEVTASFKLSQNKTAADRETAALYLMDRPDTNSHAIAHAMRATLPAKA